MLPPPLEWSTLDRLDIAEGPGDGGLAPIPITTVDLEELALADAGSAALIDEFAPADAGNPKSQ